MAMERILSRTVQNMQVNGRMEKGTDKEHLPFLMARGTKVNGKTIEVMDTERFIFLMAEDMTVNLKMEEWLGEGKS